MIEREKLQHLIENIGIPKLCLILLLGISLIIVSIPSGKTKKNAQSTETTAKGESNNVEVYLWSISRWHYRSSVDVPVTD